jgi:hypothetical protein
VDIFFRGNLSLNDEWHNILLYYSVFLNSSFSHQEFFQTNYAADRYFQTIKNTDMETLTHRSHPRPVITQAENNTTLWIGHLQTDPTDHFGGQTFTCPEAGQLDNIQLYAASVQYPGEIQLTLHEFDASSKTWGPSIGESSVQVQKTDHNKWIRFSLPPLQLKQATTYGFRVLTGNAMIGLGEAACDNQHPFTFGHEWTADSKNQRGYYYSYFSLAFKVELRA